MDGCLRPGDNGRSGADACSPDPKRSEQLRGYHAQVISAAAGADADRCGTHACGYEAERDEHRIQPLRSPTGRSGSAAGSAAESLVAVVSPVAEPGAVRGPLRHGAVGPRQGADLASAAGILG